MSFSIEDIPTIEGAGRRGRRADAPVAEAYQAFPTRASNVVGALGVSIGLQVASLAQTRAFPSGIQLSALQAEAGAGYTTHYDCGGFDYNGTCNEACFGFEPHHIDPYYCATCAEQAADPTNNPSYNWHFTGSRGNILYMDMEPDACNGKDAWKWKVGACGNCSTSAVYRCHDGYKKYPNTTNWDPTICQGLVACNDQLTPC